MLFYFSLLWLLVSLTFFFVAIDDVIEAKSFLGLLGEYILLTIASILAPLFAVYYIFQLLRK